MRQALLTFATTMREVTASSQHYNMTQVFALLIGVMGLAAIIFQPNRRPLVPPAESNTAYA